MIVIERDFKNMSKELKLENEKKEILNLLEYEEDDIIFISGSIIEGFSNKYSDLDVYILKNNFFHMNLNGMDYNSNMHKSRFQELSTGMQCDIEYWPLKVIKILIDKIKNINFEDLSIRTSNQLSIEGYSVEQLGSFIHRFVNSNVIYNEEKFNNLRKELDLNKFCKLMSRKHINILDNKYEDIIGNLESHDVETALISARNLLFELMIAYIYSEKYTIDRTKWVIKKMESISCENEVSRGVLNRFKGLYCYTNLNNENDIRFNVQNILEFSTRVITLIEKNLGGI